MDWSYASRKKLSLLKSASDPSQQRLTNYYDLVDQVYVLSRTNPDLIKAFNEANDDRKTVLGNVEHVDFKSFFN